MGKNPLYIRYVILDNDILDNDMFDDLFILLV